MEEVVGSIPTRSTKSLNSLDRASACGHDVCVVVCVIPCRFGAYGEGFHRIARRFHPHVAVPLQHPSADVTRNCHDGRIRCAALRKLSDSAMPKILQAQSVVTCAVACSQQSQAYDLPMRALWLIATLSLLFAICKEVDAQNP